MDNIEVDTLRKHITVLQTENRMLKEMMDDKIEVIMDRINVLIDMIMDINKRFKS